MSILPLLLFILPLGLDTLGVSINLGIKSRRNEITERGGKGQQFPTRLRAIKEWSELLSAFLLIVLGSWLFVS